MTAVDLPRRYRAVKRIGQGGMGEVWQVEDALARGADDAAGAPAAQALKILKAQWTDLGRERFRAEFRILASLHHPHLARVFDYGVLPDGRAYYTAELVEGPTLSDLAGGLGLPDVLRVLAALLRVLDFLSSRGLVHNDVKPSNVVVAAPPDGLKLLDFGLAGVENEAGMLSAGTPPYMAPERLRGETYDHRADLYSLGVTIYRVVAGTLPVRDEDPARILAALAEGFPPARFYRPDCPAALDDLLRRLMAVDPRERPARAAEVFDLLAAAGLGRFPRETPGTREAYALSGAFVGRDGELTLLRAATLHAGEPDAPALAVVLGPAGSGKSELLSEVARGLELGGRPVFRTRCRADGAPLAAVIDLCRFALTLAGDDAATAEAGAALGALGEPDAAGRRPALLAGAAERARLVDAAARTLAASARARPWTAVLDDLDRADDGTLETLVALDRTVVAVPAPIFVAASLRQDRARGLLPTLCDDWAARGRAVVVTLPPLSHASLGRLLDSLFGPEVFGPDDADFVLRRSAGSPLVVLEIVRALIRDGTLAASAAGWKLLPGSRRQGPAPAPAEPLAALFAERLAALPSGPRTLARALGVLGRPADRALAAAVAELGQGFAMALARLDAEGLVQHEPPARVGLFHEAFAEAALADLGADARRALHLRAALALEAAGAEEAERATHLVAAGDAARGFPAALRTGLRARDVGDFPAALRLLRGAADLADRAGATAAQRLVLDEALGDALAAQHTPAAGAEAFARAIRHAEPGSLDEARIAGKAALAHMVLQQNDEAERWIEAVRATGPRRGRALSPELERARIGLLFERGHNQLVVDACREMGERLDREAGPGLDARAAAVFRRDLLNNQAIAEVRLGRADDARATFATLERITHELGDIFTETRIANNRGFMEFEGGDLRAAVRHFERAVDLGERCGHLGVVALGMANLGEALAALGDYGRAQALMERSIAQKLRLGTATTSTASGLGWVRLAQGDVDGARVLLEGVRSAGVRAAPAVRCETALWLCAVDWLGGDAAAAQQHARMCAEVARETAAGPDRATALAAEGLALAAAGDADWALARLGEAATLWDAQRRSIRAAAARLAAAEVMRRAGRLSDARRAYDNAAGAFAEIGNPTEAARARRMAAELAEAEGALGAEGEDVLAADLMRRCGEALREIGREVERPAVAAALADAAASVLCAPRVLVVLREAEGPVVAAARGTGPELLAHPAVRARVGSALETPGRSLGAAWLCVSTSLEGAPRTALYAELPEGSPAQALGEAAAVLLDEAGRAMRLGGVVAELRSARLHDRREGPPERTAVSHAGPRRESRLLELTVGRPIVHGREGWDEIIGQSRKMRNLVVMLDRLARRDIPVLILGETGTGKELVARALHQGSPRAGGPFVAVNCASIPPTLADSLIFGHVRGAFTGALRDQRGVFEEADKGTLFLDEIGEMDASLQAKLLRVLEDRAVRPVGGLAESTVDVRVIAATNRDLAASVQAGRFRQDLYFRLSAVEIVLPPLRERPEDIPLLLRHFLGLESPAGSRPRRARVAASAMAALQAYDWPGNVRELENEVRRACVLAGDDPIRVEHLSGRLRDGKPREPPDRHTRPLLPVPGGAAARTDAAVGEAMAAGGRLGDRIAVVEKQTILEALRTAGGNKTRASKILGLSRYALYAKLRRHGIPARR